MDDAQKLATAGNHKEATGVLNLMIKELQASKYNSENLIVALIVDLQDSVKDVQPKVFRDYGYKKMK